MEPSELLNGGNDRPPQPDVLRSIVARASRRRWQGVGLGVTVAVLAGAGVGFGVSRTGTNAQTVVASAPNAANRPGTLKAPSASQASGINGGSATGAAGSTEFGWEPTWTHLFSRSANGVTVRLFELSPSVTAGSGSGSGSSGGSGSVSPGIAPVPQSIPLPSSGASGSTTGSSSGGAGSASGGAGSASGGGSASSGTASSGSGSASTGVVAEPTCFAPVFGPSVLAEVSTAGMVGQVPGLSVGSGPAWATAPLSSLTADVLGQSEGDPIEVLIVHAGTGVAEVKATFTSASLFDVDSMAPQKGWVVLAGHLPVSGSGQVTGQIEALNSSGHVLKSESIAAGLSQAVSQTNQAASSASTTCSGCPIEPPTAISTPSSGASSGSANTSCVTVGPTRSNSAVKPPTVIVGQGGDSSTSVLGRGVVIPPVPANSGAGSSTSTSLGASAPGAVSGASN